MHKSEEEVFVAIKSALGGTHGGLAAHALCYALADNLVTAGADAGDLETHLEIAMELVRQCVRNARRAGVEDPDGTRSEPANVWFRVTAQIGDREALPDGLVAELAGDDRLNEGVELTRCDREFTVSFVIPRDFNYCDAADPENENGVFGVLEILGLSRLAMIKRCQAAHDLVLSREPPAPPA